MIGLRISEAKKLFVDLKKMHDKATSAQEKANFKSAMFCKKTAQRSMRSGGKKGKVSQPGQPPRTHGKRELREYLYGVPNPEKPGGYLIGPAYLPSKNEKKNRGLTVPQTLEYSGSIDVEQVQAESGVLRDFNDPWWTEGDGHRLILRRIAMKAGRTKTRQARLLARPYMNPALMKTREKMTENYRNTFSK